MPGRQPRDEPNRDLRRRLDDVFGDVLPDTTSDEREPGQERSDSDTWLKENRPPHHGDR